MAQLDVRRVRKKNQFIVIFISYWRFIDYEYIIVMSLKFYLRFIDLNLFERRPFVN